MTQSPRITLAAASVAIIAIVNITAVALGPADIQLLLLLRISAVLAIGAALQSAALDRTDLTAALMLSLPPVSALVSEQSPTWLLPLFAAFLLVAAELHALSWECDGVGPEGIALRRRLQHIVQLGALGAAAALVVMFATVAPSPRGMAAVLIAAAALVALGWTLFRPASRSRAPAAIDS